MGAADIARALSERHPHAPRAADKARWDKLRASFLAAYRAAQDLEIKLRMKYGDASWRNYSSRGEQAKYKQLHDRAGKFGDKLFKLLLEVSPRGEAWRTGAPAYWIYRDLSWDDAVRPAGEPLSVVVPAPFGSSRGLT